MSAFKSVVSVGILAFASVATLSPYALAVGGRRRRLNDAGPPPFSWTGFYVGVNAGWAWAKSDASSSYSCPDPADLCLYPNSQVIAPGTNQFIGALGTGSINP